MGHLRKTDSNWDPLKILAVQSETKEMSLTGASKHWLSSLIWIWCLTLVPLSIPEAHASLDPTVSAQLRRLNRDLDTTQCLMRQLTRLSSDSDPAASEVRFDRYLASAREVDPKASGEQIESLAISLWGQRFLDENPLFHRALSESLSARLTASGSVDWKGRVPVAAVEQELERWIRILSAQRRLTTEEAAGLIDLRDDVIYRLEQLLRRIPNSPDNGHFARAHRIQIAEADLEFYGKYSAQILKDEPEKLGDWLLQTLGEAGRTQAVRARLHAELKVAGTPDKKIFGRYNYLSPEQGLPVEKRLSPSKKLAQALELLKTQPGAFALKYLEDTLHKGTPEQQSIWIELLLERAENGEFREVSGYVITQLLYRLEAPASLILRASELPMPPELRVALDTQLLLVRMNTAKRTSQETQRALNDYFDAAIDSRRRPDLHLIHPSSLSDEVWKNPRFAEVVRLGQPEDLLLLSEAILGALSHPEALSQPQKTTLAYLVISLTEGRKYIRNIAVRHQLDQNLLLICEKGGQSAPSLLWAN